MRTSHPLVAALALLAAWAAPARATVNVVTTTEGLAAVVREVGGDRVKVTALSRGIQDPHFVDANPSLAVKLRNADLLVDVGLDLEVGWLPPLVTQSRNGAIQPGGPRRLTAAAAITPLDLPTGPVDRSQGDIHPSGNPHFLADPRRVVQVAAAVAARLTELDPEGTGYYRERLAAFQAKVSAAEKGWREKLAPLQGRSVVTQHKTLTYLLDWAGLRAAGYLEPKPGVSPPPSHVASLAALVKSAGVKGVLVENFYDRRSADQLRDLSGVKVIVIPGDVGGTKDASDWVSYVDVLVRSLVQAVQ
ncbi:MAG: metal ABC transporter substrate-binding protein [Anaeromyxobacteraceae bacterium]